MKYLNVLYRKLERQKKMSWKESFWENAFFLNYITICQADEISCKYTYYILNLTTHSKEKQIEPIRT